MNKSILVLMVLLVAFSLPVALYAQETEPAAVINAANDAWNAGDVETLKVLYADNATVSFPDWDEILTGREQIDAWIEGLAASHFLIEPESIEVEGNTVTVVAQAWADESRAAGIAPLVTTDVYVVQDGFIMSQTSTLSEESAAKLMSVMQPETLPETGGMALPLSGALMVLGGLSFLGGMGLVRRRL